MSAGTIAAAGKAARAGGAAGSADPRNYSAVRVVGSLLTADLIGRIGAGDPSLKGLRSEDYGLVPGRRLGEAASRRWDELLGAYQAFRKRLAAAGPGDSVVSLTRDRWLLPLFDALGFGRLQYQRGGLEAEDRVFPVSHLWNDVPIHLLPWERDLDRRRGGNGGSGGDRAPQSMLQDFLNSSDEHLWGIVSNGQRLRVLRDAASLAEAAFIEFDLESMFEGELYSDFVLLFALVHASRFEPHAPEAAEEEGAVPAKPSVADCWLEKWRTEGDRTGIRFQKKLSRALRAALEELGSGFLEGDPGLREKLRGGEVSRHEFRDELLRLAYQVLFLFVAEDKGALLDPAADEATKERYRRFFSTERLRRIALERVGDRYDDLWRTLVIVLDALGADEGRPELGLPPLGGLYFTAGALEGSGDGEARPDLLRGPGVTLSNRRLLAAVRHLTRVRDDSGRWQRVDYRHLDAEELGSVYESILELIPNTDPANRVFELKEAAGNDRKTTGSYYTPTSLVETLLDSALDPVIAEHAKSGVPADLLKITVCDPACGSGHFLVAAARRIAKAYAVLEAGDDEPTPDAITKAMPEVVRNCVYGVDLSPLAVELSKVSLWLASLEPGKPLAFLDAHIRVGNALLGTTPKLLEGGIPDGAFKALEGDDKKFVGVLKKQNKKERETGQASLLTAGEGFSSNVKLAEAARRVNQAVKPGLAGVREQARRLRELDNSPEKVHAVRTADAWCAAFVWPKRPDAPAAVTSATMWRLTDATGSLTAGQERQLADLARRYQFFHWYLEFPEVFPGIDDTRDDYNPDTGWQGGFTCVLGNPPWDRVKLAEKEFFASRDPEIADAPNKAKREALIKRLSDSDDGVDLLREFHEAKNKSEGISLLLRDSGRYPLNGRGDVNTYSVFTESGKDLLHPRGRLGIIVPTGIVTDATTQHFFKDIVQRRVLATVYDFENRNIFPDVHSSYKFTLLTIAGRGTTVERADFAFFLHDTAELSDADKRFTLSAEEISLLSPNTGTCPIFRSRHNANLLIKIKQKIGNWIATEAQDGNPWGIRIRQGLYHLTNDSASGKILDSAGQKIPEDYIGTYEAKLINQYDHRFASYGTPDSIEPTNRKQPEVAVKFRYFANAKEFNNRIPEDYTHPWLLTYRDIARSTDARSVIAAIIPRSPTSYTLRTCVSFSTSKRKIVLLAGIMNSLILDYSARQLLSGIHLSDHVAQQLPIPTPDSLTEDLQEQIISRVLELTYTAWDMEPFARDLDDSGAPFVWDDERRFLMRCELDAAFFHLYGIERNDVSYIMETFPIVKKKDLKVHGSYRTKETILDIYDAMAKATETSEPYQTVLDPPPGEGPRHPERG